jgi:hypothetical protein
VLEDFPDTCCFWLLASLPHTTPCTRSCFRSLANICHPRHYESVLKLQKRGSNTSVKEGSYHRGIQQQAMLETPQVS